MPELPEVENVRRGLTGAIIGRRVVGVRVCRDDVVHGQSTPASLLRGRTITRIDRLGKQLALTGTASGTQKQCPQTPWVCIHLGMTGSLCYSPRRRPHRPTDHTHVTWRLDDGGTLAFRDPRRFGGLWTYPSREALNNQRWARLGPDALTITPSTLHKILKRTRTPLKTALLDQGRIAGLGNIYIDELLFTCRLHPMTPANACTAKQARQLVGCMRRLLNRAIRAGGSTLRDYVGADGRSGGFQSSHRVYGRSGRTCVRCKTTLSRLCVAGRTTVCCNVCQTG